MMLLSLFIIFLLNLLSKCSTRIHYLSINENDFAPRHLLTFNSPNPQTSFTILTSNLQEYFSIENQSQLYTLQSLDREYFCKKDFCSCSISCSIALKILVQPEYEILFLNLTIKDLNDNLHSFPFEQIELLIPENLNHRQCYRIPSVNDEDLLETNQFHYRLIGNENQRFEINQTLENHLCLIIRNYSLDREECERYDHLSIIAEDEQKQQAKMKIIIQVLDINDNSPRFSTNSTILHVNETFSGQLICISAYDPDRGNNGHVIYSFDHMERKLFDYFYLNNQTGCITILQPLLLTSIDNHLFITIRAQDLGSKMSSTLPSYHSLELFIQDINDHKPIMEVKQMIFAIQILKNNSKINIVENTVGILAIISIEDLDQGIYGEVQLNLIVQSKYENHQHAFQIKYNSKKHYKLELINPLDYELESSFILYLEALDGGGQYTRFIWNIFIENQNDRKPQFEQNHYYFIINIQSPSSIFHPTLIGQVHAVDDDSPTDFLIYSLNSSLFQIDAHTGEINLMTFLSINMTDQILNLIVYVTDGELFGEANVTILIQGYNHSPLFEKQEYYFEICENVPIRTMIGQINAKDEDFSSTPRGELTYSIRSITSYSEYFFHITRTGEILVARIPDAEEQQLHELIIIVKDHGTPPLSDQTKVRIKINDQNEYCPKLVNQSSQPYLFITREYFSSQILFTYQLFAFDDDISDQSNIQFHLIPSGFSHLFDLQSNGLLILKEFPLKIPSIIELRYSLSDKFFPQPCITQEKLILFISETFNDCNDLLNQYQTQFDHFRKSHLIPQKTNQSEVHLILLVFLGCILVIFISLLYLIIMICCYRRKRHRSLTTKSSHIINPILLFENYQERSPHSFLMDSNC